MLETLGYLAALLLFAATLLPRRMRQRFADAPSYVVPFLRAAVPWLAAHLAQLAAQAWRFCVELGRLIEPLAYRLVTGRDPAAREGQMFHSGGTMYRAQSWGDNASGLIDADALPPPVPVESPLPAAENPDLHGGDPLPTEAEIPPATADELQALGRALRHNLTSADKTKSGAIKAGWGLSRSGTDPRYRRASQLYDLATKEPVPPPRPELRITRRSEPKARN
ncbi:hypothetical protein SE17_16170 [Kouleothrix aurantiaca]|uniref:Uncharacterized protein n=1 Tax=Kouleothrix aurantiaca TaxID=186479 RepID=A0A0P9D0F3_9CHLR|nr:hypothetical protein SE17_16170 [Kouleothrix aurantiaca]